MKYGIRRKFNIKARVSEQPQYEMVDLEVLDADTPEEAEEALKVWALDYFKKLKELSDKGKTTMSGEQTFIESLN